MTDAVIHSPSCDAEIVLIEALSAQLRVQVGSELAATHRAPLEEKERRATENQWKERDKQIERVIVSTVGMYGEMSGILSGALLKIPALELDDGCLLEESPLRDNLTASKRPTERLYVRTQTTKARKDIL